LVVLAVAIGGWNNRLGEVTNGAFDGAKTAVTIALGLIGIMALWLGVMRLANGPDWCNASPARCIR
jgi:spore maturation protein A